MNINNNQLTQIITQAAIYNINSYQLYIGYFKNIPNVLTIGGLDCLKTREYLEKQYANNITEQYVTEISDHSFNDKYLILQKEHLMIHISNHVNSMRLFYFQKTAFINNIIDQCQKFKKNKNRQFSLACIVHTHNGYDLRYCEVFRPKLNMKDNYNNDFMEIHKIILQGLLKKNGKGLVLLHGKPGTGKTSYIRYLITLLKNKVIFLPPNVATALTNPDFISILFNNQNCILVIEDAENILIDRKENSNNHSISALLNISDGLLSDCLNIKIICSFNIDISKVDSALMRKGRLIAQYEFKELEIIQTNALSNKLGFNTQFDTPMTLASIYNQDEKDFQQIKRNNVVGFKQCSNE